MRRPRRPYPYRARWKRALAVAFDTLGDALRGFRSWREPPAPGAARPLPRRGPPYKAWAKGSSFGPDGGAVRRVLVVRLDHLGDVLFSTVVFRPLRRLFPMAQITALVGPWAAPLLLHHPDVDRVVSFRCPWFDRRGTSGWANTLGALQFLRRSCFDVGLDLRGDPRVIALMVAGGVRYRAGYGWGGGGFLLSRELDHPPGLHQVDRNLLLVKAFGWKEEGEDFRRPRVFVSKAEEEDAKARLLALGVGEGERLVALHPGASVPAKRWPAEHYASLMAWLSSRPGLKLLLLGGPEERGLAAKVAALSGVYALNLAGEVSLRGLMAVLDRCHLMIGNDSGPTHLAAALGVPTVALFSGTNQATEWAPIGDRVHLIEPLSGTAQGEDFIGEIQVEDVEKVIEGCGLA